jgi:hypothetical protein
MRAQDTQFGYEACPSPPYAYATTKQPTEIPSHRR